jgi:mannose-6-phosphate isomerase-like protein (cupin superfamily)
MKRLVIALFALMLTPLLAAEPPGFAHWTNTDLQALGKKLASKMSPQKVATENLANYGNHLVMIAHREGDGEAELHEFQADVFIVTGGKAALVVGGSVVEGKTTAPGEIRGRSISGGEKKNLAAGDIVHIPARVPHQLLIESGSQFNYVIVKVDAK